MPTILYGLYFLKWGNFMLKKIIVLLLTICTLLLAVGCSAIDKRNPFSQPTEKVFSIDNYKLQITADTTFKEDTDGEFDLQITNDECYISVMTYKYVDIAEDLTPMDVFDMQNDALFSQRGNVTVVEKATTQTLGQKSIIKALYSAEKDKIKNYYVAYLIDIPENETLSWVLVSAMPTYIIENKENIDNIVYSLESIK